MIVTGDGPGPEHKEVTKDIRYVVYDCDLSREYWENTKRIEMDVINNGHFRSYELGNGKIVQGKLESIQSCVSAPRIMYQVKKWDDQIETLEGLLIGTPEKLGVALLNVDNIKL